MYIYIYIYVQPHYVLITETEARYGSGICHRQSADQIVDDTRN